MKIYCVEGLATYFWPSPLTSAVKSLNLPRVEIVKVHWLSSIKKLKLENGDIVAMHSFGIRLLADILAMIDIRGLKITLFILDGRMPPLGWWLQFYLVVRLRCDI